MLCASASVREAGSAILVPVSTTEEQSEAHCRDADLGIGFAALLGWIAVAGACGAVLRLLLVGLGDEEFMRFPWVTLGINLLGSGVLGILVGVAHAWPGLPSWTVPVLGTGFLGSFTTFSSVIVTMTAAQQRELFAQLHNAEVIPPGVFEVLAYLVISMLFCTAAAAAGITVGRALFGCSGMACDHAGPGGTR